MKYEYNGIHLDGKVAIVVGGTTGIGQAIALGMVREGAKVIPTSRTLSKCEQTVEKIKEMGAQSLLIATDITDVDQVETLVTKVVEQFGKVDVLVNSAGATLRKSSVDITESEWNEVIDVNLKGTFLTCQKVGRVMLAQGSGSIINIASIASFVAYPEVAPYCASKGGVLLLTRALAIEWAKRGVRVNGIAPGDFITPLTETLLAKGTERRRRVEARIPIGRLGQLDELIGAAVYLASDTSQYVTGETIVVDGGHMAEGI